MSPIPANCTIEDLKRDYNLVIEQGRTRVKVDGEMKWILQTRYSAAVKGKTIHAIDEMLNDKATPELLAKQQSDTIDALKLHILKMEEGV